VVVLPDSRSQARNFQQGMRRILSRLVDIEREGMKSSDFSGKILAQRQLQFVLR